MEKFNKTYTLILEDIIQSVSPEELEQRQTEYRKIKLKMLFEKLFDTNKMTENIDGSYDVNDNINLYDMRLTSLTDMPYRLNIVKGTFYCAWNHLTNLIGCPKIIYGNFNCNNNELDSLEGCPDEVAGNFYIHRNNSMFNEEDIHEVCKVGGDIIV